MGSHNTCTLLEEAVKSDFLGILNYKSGIFHRLVGRKIQVLPETRKEIRSTGTGFGREVRRPYTCFGGSHIDTVNFHLTEALFWS